MSGRTEPSWRRGRLRLAAGLTRLLCLAPILFATPAVAAGPEAAPFPPAGPVARPRIGLALGGGGAKGLAHVGVLSVLDEMRIPIDCVVGASMGALVGGAFATGMTAEEMQEAVDSVSWEETIAFRGKRAGLPMRRKLAGTTYSNSLEFGVRDGRFLSPRGFINTQNIDQVINMLVARGTGVSDFQQLAVPYSAVATDMQTGDMVVLSSGDLATAMRASMAVPGVFAPVTIDGRILGDGGLSRNVPVDVARQSCADVVIAVAVPNPIPTAEELQSPLSMMKRTIEVLIGANERQQLDSLGPDDVKIIVDTAGAGSASFSKAAEMMPLGRAAAEQQSAALRRYSLPAEEYLAWRDAHRRPLQTSFTLASVKLDGPERADPDFIRTELGLEPGQTVSADDVRRRTSVLYSMGDFESVQYSLGGEPERTDLEVLIREKSWGPNILRFDLGLHVGNDGDTAFLLGGNYLRPWVNRQGGEIHGRLQLGRTSAANASFYQPIDSDHQYFVEPGIILEQSLEDIYFDGEAETRYRFSKALGYLEAGRVFGTRAEFRLGVTSGLQSARRDIAVPWLPEITDEGYGGWLARFTYDNRDRPALATRGWLGRLNYYRADRGLGSEYEYDRLEGLISASIPFHDDVISLRTAGGTAFGSTLPPYDLFVLGGPTSFPGFKLGELRGQGYWTFSAAYLRKIADISTLFGQSLYAGLRLTAGEMSERIDVAGSEPIYSAAALIGAQTPLGPLSLSLALSSTDAWQLVLNLGRPIDEGTITDPAW